MPSCSERVSRYSATNDHLIIFVRNAFVGSWNDGRENSAFANDEQSEKTAKREKNLGE